MTPPVPAVVVRAARAIGIQPSSLAAMHPHQARKLALQAARLHEGRREHAARALDDLEVFDELLAGVSIATQDVRQALRSRADRQHEEKKA